MRPGLVLASLLAAGILAGVVFAAEPKEEPKTAVQAVPILIIPILSQSQGLDTAAEDARLKAALAKESRFKILPLEAKDGCSPLDRQACLILARRQKAQEVFTGTIARDENGTVIRRLFRYSFDLLIDGHTSWKQTPETNVSLEKMLAVQLDSLLGRAKNEAVGVAEPAVQKRTEPAKAKTAQPVPR